MCWKFLFWFCLTRLRIACRTGHPCVGRIHRRRGMFHEDFSLSRIVRVIKLKKEKYPEQVQGSGFEDPFPFYRTEDSFIAKVLVDEYHG